MLPSSTLRGLQEMLWTWKTAISESPNLLYPHAILVTEAGSNAKLVNVNIEVAKQPFLVHVIKGFPSDSKYSGYQDLLQAT